jgi:formylglycine-generating enzyme required for sulfatase activity
LPEGIQRGLRRNYGEKWAFLADQQKVREGMDVVKKMGALKCRPMLLSYIEDLMESGFEKAELNEYQIYNALVKSWLRREHLKKKDISEEALFKASVILATILQRQDRRSISETELKQLIGKIGEVMPIQEVDFKGRSLINRNSDGDYRFSHYSIQEFCVAKLLIEKPPVFSPKWDIMVTDLVLDFVRLSGVKGFNFPDLVDIGIVEALNLSWLDLTNIDFSGVDISGGNFNGARIEGAIFDWEVEITNELGMTFRFIPPGTFMMGSPEDEPGRHDDEKLHRVKITSGFYMQTTAVTQGQWEAVMGNNPSYFKNAGPGAPVERVSWKDVQESVGKLNEKEGSEVYRLPTEAEWEYACRAGTETAFSWGNEADCDFGNYGAGLSSSCEGKNPGRPMEVQSFSPNPWGIFDMHGNVYEWCSDWYGHNYYNKSPGENPQGPDSGVKRVIRGGGWGDFARYCRSACRGELVPDIPHEHIGFRLVRLPGH